MAKIKVISYNDNDVSVNMVCGAVFRLRVNISWFCFVSPLLLLAVSRRRGGGRGDFLPIILWEQILLTQWRQYCHQGGGFW